MGIEGRGICGTEDKASLNCPGPTNTTNATNLICPAQTSSTNITAELLPPPPNYYFPFKANIEIEDGEADGIDGTNAGLEVC